jgi:hypothetical protein
MEMKACTADDVLFPYPDNGETVVDAREILTGARRKGCVYVMQHKYSDEQNAFW